MRVLQYAIVTRPDISFVVDKVWQFLSNPLEDHWKVVKRILRYLQGIVSHGLLFNPANLSTHITITGFCDADWASDPDDRRFISWVCIFLSPNLVSWWAKKQTQVTRSSVEAEYRSMTPCYSRDSLASVFTAGTAHQASDSYCPV